MALLFYDSLALSFSSGHRSAPLSCGNCYVDSFKNMLRKWTRIFQQRCFPVENVGILSVVTCDQEIKITPVSRTLFHPKSPSLGSLKVKVFENWETHMGISALWQQPSCSWLFQHEWVSLSAVLCTKRLKSASFSLGVEKGWALLSWVCFATCWQLEGQPLWGAARSGCDATPLNWPRALLWTHV